MFNAQERTLREIVCLARSAGWRVTKVTRAQGSLFGHILAVPCEVPAGAYDAEQEDIEGVERAVEVREGPEGGAAVPSGVGKAQGTHRPITSVVSSIDLHGLVDGLGLALPRASSQSEAVSHTASSELGEKRDTVVVDTSPGMVTIDEKISR